MYKTHGHTYMYIHVHTCTYTYIHVGVCCVTLWTCDSSSLKKHALLMSRSTSAIMLSRLTYWRTWGEITQWSHDNHMTRHHVAHPSHSHMCLAAKETTSTCTQSMYTCIITIINGKITVVQITSNFVVHCE